ncbi:MAG: hypothetical protein ACRDHE_06580, partial [Ktedonobacterales bacterium]
MDCPNCPRREAPADEEVCPDCGFRIGERFWVRWLLDETRRHLNVRSSIEARDKLDQAYAVWAPKHPDALAREITELRAEERRQEEEDARASSQLSQLVKERRYFAARAFMRQLPATFPQREGQRQAIDAAITQAEKTFLQTRQPGVTPERSADLCVQALGICTDYAEPRDLLARMPPEPPSDLQVTPSERLVSLTWKPSATRNANYVIVRKAASQPVSPNDGSRIATIAGYRYDDTQPEMGVSLYYAIFAERGGVESARGAGASRSVLLVDDVKKLAQRINNRTVELTWEPPKRALRVVVTRTEGAAPRSYQDGVARHLVDNAHVVDHDVENGRRYYYGVYCQFADAEGRVLTSRGACIEATPETPPVAPEITCTTVETPKGFETLITWTAPVKGDVVVIRSPASGQAKARAGDILRADSLADYGAIVQGGSQSLTDTWSTPGVCVYTPAVIFQRTAYVGEPRRCVRIADVRDLKAQNLGARIQLTWVWPSGCTD